MQKTYILPGRKVYEYPYTPELFPWFYDRALWTEYLDFLVANRLNTLYLWNGHPFASLVRLADYPDAVEVPDEVFRNGEYVLNSTAHWRPLMNGYSGVIPDSYRERADTLWLFPAEFAMQTIQRDAVTHVVGGFVGLALELELDGDDRALLLARRRDGLDALERRQLFLEHVRDLGLDDARAGAAIESRDRHDWRIDIGIFTNR